MVEHSSPAAWDAVALRLPQRRLRFDGVDIARGIALLGMVAVHVFDCPSPAGTPTAATAIAGGRSAATFALVAGVSLTFLSGRRQALRGPPMTAACCGIAVRALLIAFSGLVLGYVTDEANVILVYYGLFFLLALPLLGLRPRVLVAIVAATIMLGPVLLLASFDADLPSIEGNPTLTTIVEEPIGLIVGLLVTGTYPAIIYLAHLVAGLAIGRSDLTSTRVATGLIGGGLVLALISWDLSWVLLFPFGGLAQLGDAAPSELSELAATNRILWNPDETATWWWLALRAPHSGATLDVVHSLGSAMAVLGTALLLSRIPAVARLLRPLAAAGSMTLTLYAAHLFVLPTDLVEEAPGFIYLLLVGTALAGAPLWRRWRRQGILESVISTAADRTRRAVPAVSTRPSTSGKSGDS